MSAALPAAAREVLADGVVRLTAGACTFLYERLRPGVLLITISGQDNGQFGPATVDEAAAEFGRFSGPVRLFVDTRGATGPTRQVMETWTEWFAANRARLERVVILVPPESKLLHLTVSIVQHISRTGGLIRICGETAEFEAAIRKEVPGFSRPQSGASPEPTA
jgi:hypothetical protein